MANTTNEVRKGFPKTAGILLIIGVAAVITAIILLHHNPLAVQSEEWLKKGIACAVLWAGVLVATILYDKIV